jgi:hypothetical protein
MRFVKKHTNLDGCQVYAAIIDEAEVGSFIAGGNSYYQILLDDVIDTAGQALDGDIPAELQTAADTKRFNQQRQTN